MRVNRRVDHLNAMLVDAAIAVRGVYGELAAAQVLLSRKLDHALILRVLSNPASRRTDAYKPLYG